MVSSINRKSWAEIPNWAKDAIVGLGNGHIMTKSRPAEQDEMNFESFRAHGKLVQGLTLNLRPICCVFRSSLDRMFSSCLE